MKTTLLAAVCLAAMLPRLTSAQDAASGGAGVERYFQRLDRNGDGKLTREEIPRLLNRLDTDGDGAVTVDEARAIGQRDEPKRENPQLPPIAPYRPGPAPLSDSEAFTRLQFAKDYFPSTKDRHGVFTTGTECNYIVAHDGKLFATVSCWNLDRNGPNPGPHLLVKPAAGKDWEVDALFGPDYLRAECLASITFSTDGRGNSIDPPVTLLMAGAERIVSPRNIGVWVRDDASGQWSRTVISNDITRGDGRKVSGIRAFVDHLDPITGVHSVYCAASSGAIFRGVYDPAAAGKIAWETAPEFQGAAARIHSFCEADGRLYASVGVNPFDPKPRSGGLFRRIDGDGRWEWLYQWDWTHPDGEAIMRRSTGYGRGGPKPGMRGMTSVSAPDGEGEFVLAAREHPGIIVRIDPRNGVREAIELDIRQYFKARWPGYAADRGVTLFAYNDLVPVTHPDTGESMHLIGGWVTHPGRRHGDTVNGNASWYLIRHADGRYAHGRISDPEHPAASGLRGARTICASPFREEAGRVLYFGGFDAAGGPHRDTAWIYKGTLRNE